MIAHSISPDFELNPVCKWEKAGQRNFPIEIGSMYTNHNTKGISIGRLARLGMGIILGAFVSLFTLGCNEKTHSEHNHATGKGMIFESAQIRLAPPGSQITGAYLKITNHGPGDRLVSAKTSVAGVVEIHEMKETDGMMKMRKMENGLSVGEHQTEVLRPGGNHLMLLELKRDLKAQETVAIELEFEKSGSHSVEFTVTSSDELHPSAKHGADGHKH